MSRFAAGSRANTMLVTKALSQDVMLLAFVPLLLIPKESPSLHSNQLIHMTYVCNKMSSQNLMIDQKNYWKFNLHNNLMLFFVLTVAFLG
ncbi:hypothetical protein LSPCS325_44440 [Lysinibacillus sp. CTST325]